MSNSAAHTYPAQDAIPGVTLDVHFKLFGTDGVSLQSQELTEELVKREWTVHLCASDVPQDHRGVNIPALSYQSPEVIDIRKQIFAPASKPFQPRISLTTETALLEKITDQAAAIKGHVETYIDTHSIRLVHIRNIMALPLNLAATLAFYELATERRDIQFILHHHDLMWEGPNAKNFATSYPRIATLIDRIICPDLPNATHVLINPLAATMLRQKRGIGGVVIPDGFNFDRQTTRIDETAFRRSLELFVGDNCPITNQDLIVGMMARVAINKAIELAIQFVAHLERARTQLEQAPYGVGIEQRRFTADSRIILLLGQGEDLAESREYLRRLLRYAEDMGVTVAYAGNSVVPDSAYTPDGKRYPFYSTYQAVDVVCYPTEHEGFGNQAIEAVWAKRPLALHEYPVFDAYIRNHLPHIVSLGKPSDCSRPEYLNGLYQLNETVLDAAVKDTITLLCNPEQERAWTEENYKVLKAFCGIQPVADRYVQLYHTVRSKRPVPGLS